MGLNDSHHHILLLQTSTWILHSTARNSTAAAARGCGPSPGQCSQQMLHRPPIPTPLGRAAIWGMQTWESFPGGTVATTYCEPLAWNVSTAGSSQVATRQVPNAHSRATALLPEESPGVSPTRDKSGQSLNTLQNWFTLPSRVHRNLDSQVDLLHLL